VNRIEIIDMLEARGVRLGEGFSLRTDADVELARAAWDRRGAPRDVQIDAGTTETGGVEFRFTPRNGGAR